MKKSNNISLKNDYAFTQIMTQPKIPRGFLSSILHIPPKKIGTIHIKDRHLSKDLLEGKLSILDLYTVVEGTGKINIEMKVLPYAHWDRRSLSYLAKVYTQDLKSGEAYANCVKAIHISILGFNQLTDTDYFYSSFHMREDSRHSLYSYQWEVHVIELSKLNSSKVKEEHKKLYQWACFICAEGEEERAMIEKEPYIEEAIRELELLERDPERMDEYLFRQKNLSDYVTADAVTGENAECFLIKKHMYEDRDAAKQLEYSCFAASFVSRCRVCSAMLYKFLPLRKKDRV